MLPVSGQGTNESVAEKGERSEPGIRSFQRSLPMLLMRAREAVMARFRPNLRQHDITEQQWRVLRVLAEQESVEMLDLAQRCCIQPPSLSRTIPLLVRRGLVRRSNGSDDQRRILVKLTPKGQDLFQVMSAESARVYAHLESEIGVARQAEIYQTLDELIAIANSGAPKEGK